MSGITARLANGPFDRLLCFATALAEHTAGRRAAPFIRRNGKEVR